MKYRNFSHKVTLSVICMSFFILAATGCAPMKTAIEKRNLQASTKMSETIFLDPVNNNQKTVYVQIKNTSQAHNLNLTSRVDSKLRENGYRVVSEPSKAHYLLQANVVNLSRMNKKQMDDYLSNGYGSEITGGALGALAGAATHSNSAPLIGGVAGSFVGMVADSAIKDVNYTLITDVQLSERLPKGEQLRVKSRSKLNQGNSSQETVEGRGQAQWKRYRTRIVSNAEKVNLKFAQAKPELELELAGAIAGLF